MSGIKINGNIAFGRVLGALSDSSRARSVSLERLSSGLRINKSSDDPAGLSVADLLRSNSHVFTQAVRNLNEGISFFSIAESALAEMKNILLRQRELSVEASNGSFSSSQRAALDRELQQLSQEYNRILEGSSYNGRMVFTRANGALVIQAGYGSTGTLSGSFESIQASAEDDTERTSVAVSGQQTNDWSEAAGLSGDGRYVLFRSVATNLVAGDTNGVDDYFVRDRVTGAVTRVTVNSSGTEANGDNYYGSISADGRYVAFKSSATNLASGDTNGVYDIFVHDLETGQTTRVNTSTGGAQANAESYSPSISASGRYVVYESDATNLVSDDDNASMDIFWRDTVTGETQRVSVNSAGTEANDGSLHPAVSADGRYVVFQSYATNLTAEATPGVFMRDMLTGTTTLISVSSSGVAGNADSAEGKISADGRYVTFESDATNLVAGDTNGLRDVFLRDLSTGQTSRLSLASSGAQSNDSCFLGSISADGRYVSFSSAASNLVTGDTNGAVDIFVRDTISGETRRISLSSSGAESTGVGMYSYLSGDGRYVAFDSDASNLVSGDSNGVWDSFVTGNPLLNWFQVTRSKWLSLETQADAQTAQGWIDSYLEEVSAAQGKIGAFMSRASSASASLTRATDNFKAAESRIRDVDVAAESAELLRNSIRQEAATAVLAQANQAPALALQLLSGGLT